jgi:hypothetical protein
LSVCVRKRGFFDTWGYNLRGRKRNRTCQTP